MLQPKYLLMKRGTLLNKEPRESRKAFAAIGFTDFSAGISVVFAESCPAAVSESETVFLCPLGSSVAPRPRHNSFLEHGAGALKTARLTRFSF
jgi:hypothetical protein